MTTVSEAGVLMEAKSAAASAAMKRAEEGGRLLRVALVVADAMEEDEMSIPKLDWKRDDNVIVKRPEPE